MTLKKKGKDFLNLEESSAFIWVLVLILAACFFSACANITPVVNERETVAYDGNDQTAGIIQDFEDHSSEITPNARDRYNDLIWEREGMLKFSEKKDFGIAPMDNGNFRITAQGKEYWYSLKLDKEGDLK